MMSDYRQGGFSAKNLNNSIAISSLAYRPDIRLSI
jgi:hypothetical protein